MSQKDCRYKFRHDIWDLIAKDRYGLGKKRPDGKKSVPLVTDGNDHVPLTERVIDDLYVEAGEYIAVRACNGNKSSILVFDLDDHDKKLPPHLMQIAAAELIIALHKTGMTCQPAISSSGHGYHVWVQFERARTRTTVIDHAKGIIGKLNDRLASQGLNERLTADRKDWIWPITVPPSFKEEHSWPHDAGTIKVELHPKSDMATVALPGVWDGRLLKYRVTGDNLTFEEGYSDWRPCELRKPGPKVAGAGERDEAFDVLARTYDCTVRDDWIEFGTLLVAAFGHHDEWALARYKQWSADGYAGYDERETEKRWRGFKPTKFSDKSFWIRARQAGYSGKTPLSKADEGMAIMCEIVEGLTYARNVDKVAYCVTNHPYCVPVDCKAFLGVLFDLYKAQTGLLPSRELTRSAQIYAERQAKDAPQELIPPRFAKRGSVCFVNVGKEVYEVDKSGWRVTENSPLFLDDQDCLPEPKQADLSAFDCVNLNKTDLIKAIAYILSVMHGPDNASPHLLITGGADVAKSSVGLILTQTMDPHSGKVVSPPSDETNLLVAVTTRQLVCFDNCSEIKKDVSDALCRLTTDAGFVARRLYTNGEEYRLTLRRSVILNGLYPDLSEQDLMSRVVGVSPPPIADDKKIDDDELPNVIAAGHGARVACLLDMLSCVLKNAQRRRTGFRFGRYVSIGEVVAQHYFAQEAGWFTELMDKEALEAKAATSEDSIVGKFLSSHYVHELYGASEFCEKFVKAAEVYVSFERWIENNGHFGKRPRSPKALTQALVAIGDTMRERYGIWAWHERERYMLGFGRENVEGAIEDCISTAEPY